MKGIEEIEVKRFVEHMVKVTGLNKKIILFIMEEHINFLTEMEEKYDL